MLRESVDPEILRSHGISWLLLASTVRIPDYTIAD